ncbi:MAG TPA: hypothetical protein VGJ82_14525 [Thermoanaerobaculia bacterium]|jgi:hypothetical protein
MADHSPLIVPIDLQAMLVNSWVRGQNFQRWRMVYSNLTKFVSPEPIPFSGSDGDWGRDPANDGIWLHWRLPAALRHGTHDTVTSTTRWPFVPNRWAVIRFSGPLDARVAAGWVVESDYLDPENGSSSYIDPFAPTLTMTHIGRVLPLPWTVPAPQAAFLTAVSPGNVNFAAYQPYVDNVFSMHDSLSGIAEGEMLSYVVVGWYSDPATDILATWGTSGNFIDYIGKLGWSVTQPTDTATKSVYEGFVYGLQWQSKKPRRGEALLAVANTSIDALTAMVAKQAVDDPTIDPELLQAFQYDLVRMLDEPNGQLLVDRAINHAWFGAFNGGYVWEIVAANDDDITTSPTQSVPDWLYQLNRDQLAYDTLVTQCGAAQYNLYQVWWKQGKARTRIPYPYGLTPEEFAAAFDASDPNSLVSQVHDLMLAVDNARNNIPWGDTQDQLDASIIDFARRKSLPSTMQLKRSDQRHFHDANDPVVCISGANAQSKLDESVVPLPCRFSHQVVTGFNYDDQAITASNIGNAVPFVNTTNLPPVTNALITELFFLDPEDATLVAKDALGSTNPETIKAVKHVMDAHDADIGTVPVLLAPWTQPWAPLFMMWQATFYPIVYGTNDNPNWTFDGQNYNWTGNGAETSVDTILQIAGRIFLTPQSSFNFKSRIDQYLKTYPDADLKAVEQFITEKMHWDFLSQSLTGFNEQLILQNPMSLLAPDNQTVYFAPDYTLAKLVDSGAVSMPIPGEDQPSFGKWPPSGFQQFRSGQFFFERLMIVDRFGQSAEIVNSRTADQFAPVIGEGLVPKTVLPLAPQKWVQLTPRLLQPARLDLDFVSATNDNEILNLDAGVNPICAWVLPNHIDRSIACYGPAGQALGAAYVILDEQEQFVMQWFAAPFSTYKTIGSLAENYPQLASFLAGVQAAGPDAFDAMLRTIDATLWSIDPLGNRDDQYLSVLIGRPLALVRSRLQYEYDGPAVSDPSWRFTFSPDPPETPNYTFPVRLGDLPLRDDGLIGYYVGSDYSKFDAVYVPRGVSSPYVQQIGPGNFLDMQFNSSSVVYLTMFVDPRASVNAFTDLLPVTTIAIPQQFVAPALANMEVTFNVGPLLSDRRQPQGQPAQILMPLPAEKSGTWSWVQNDGTTPTEYGVVTVDQTAQFSNVPPVLRSGWLRLSAALKK